MGGILLAEENEHALLLHDVLERQANLSDAFDRVQKPRAQPRSVMACDNQASAPMQVEHFVSYCLLQTVDLGRAMKSMLHGEDGSLHVPIMAFYPLVRAQIESASMAVWVMAPVSRRGRVLRRLQAAHDELAHERALTKSGLKGRSAAEANDLLRKEAARQKRQKGYLRAISAANGIASEEYENTFPSWESIVREAGESLGLDNDALVVIWRLASGFTHPSFRRGASVLEFTHPDTEGDVLSGVLSSRTDWTIALLGMAGRASRGALERWRDLKIQVNGEWPVPSPVYSRR